MAEDIGVDGYAAKDIEGVQQVRADEDTQWGYGQSAQLDGRAEGGQGSTGFGTQTLATASFCVDL